MAALDDLSMNDAATGEVVKTASKGYVTAQEAFGNMGEPTGFTSEQLQVFKDTGFDVIQQIVNLNKLII